MNEKKHQPFLEIIGVDQTGAWSRQRGFAPLYIARTTRKHQRAPWEPIQFSRKSLDQVLKEIFGERLAKVQNQNTDQYTDQYTDQNLSQTHASCTLIVIDAVLGMPLSRRFSRRSVRQWISQAPDLDRQDPLNDEGKFGLQGSERFFGSIEKAAKFRSILRLCDQVTRAQSILRSKPFQRNIQPGTLRVWAELKPWIQNPKTRHQIGFWPFECGVLSERRVWIAEGYPSYFKRNEMTQAWPKDPNFQDAARLVRAAQHSMLQGLPEFDWRSVVYKQIQREGWIFGVPIPNKIPDSE